MTQEARPPFIGPTWGLIGLCAILAGSLADPLQVEAQIDFDPASTGWNGLSEWVQLAGPAEIRLDTPERVDVGELSPSDAIVLVHPDRDLPIASLSAFLRAGGRVVLADDFGSGERFVESFGITRGPPSDPPRTIRGNPQLPVAHALGRHPLTEGVDTVVGNHAQALRHPDLTALLAFDDDGHEGLLLTGAVERGRLVVLSDSSVLINNMLQFDGNRRLAENLMRYLGNGENGRVILVTPGVPVVGRYGGTPGAPIERLRDVLADVAGADLPPTALTLLALVFVSILTIFTVSSLPRRAPYTAADAWGPEPVGGGFTGRVAFFRKRPKQLVHPALVYGYEVEAALRRSLFASGGARDRTLAEVTRAAVEKGLESSEIADLRGLLTSFATLRREADRPGGPPRVSPQRLRRMVDSGERLIARLEESE